MSEPTVKIEKGERGNSTIIHNSRTAIDLLMLTGAIASIIHAHTHREVRKREKDKFASEF